LWITLPHYNDFAAKEMQKLVSEAQIKKEGKKERKKEEAPEIIHTNHSKRLCNSKTVAAKFRPSKKQMTCRQRNLTCLERREKRRYTRQHQNTEKHVNCPREPPRPQTNS
jgi:hypothetical protein